MRFIILFSLRSTCFRSFPHPPPSGCPRPLRCVQIPHLQRDSIEVVRWKKSDLPSTKPPKMVSAVAQLSSALLPLNLYVFIFEDLPFSILLNPP